MGALRDLRTVRTFPILQTCFVFVWSQFVPAVTATHFTSPTTLYSFETNSGQFVARRRFSFSDSPVCVYFQILFLETPSITACDRVGWLLSLKWCMFSVCPKDEIDHHKSYLNELKTRNPKGYAICSTPLCCACANDEARAPCFDPSSLGLSVIVKASSSFCCAFLCFITTEVVDAAADSCELIFLSFDHLFTSVLCRPILKRS